MNVRNLLYLESELAELEATLDTMDEEALLTDDRRERIALLTMSDSWESLNMIANEGNPAAVERQKLIRSLREKLKEYCT